jgi:hypothetical protein
VPFVQFIVGVNGKLLTVLVNVMTEQLAFSGEENIDLRRFFTWNS